MFSARVPADLTPNRLTAALAQLHREQRPILDLTTSNPTRADLSYPEDLLTPLGHPRGLVYAPQSLGAADARLAVATDFTRRGLSVPPARIVLTSSTSEAYSLIFKVLCDPGDEVLVPRPSYPLFEHLARLDAVTAVPYQLEYHGAWAIDMLTVERAITPRTRALLLVSPNNPTGNFVSRGEMDRLAALCASNDMAIVSDEVFADYELTPGAAGDAGSWTDRLDVLAFTLGGLSKSVGLPQAKLGWIAVSGADAGTALERLELACDTYLSVSTPVQCAAGDLLARGAIVREQIQRRVNRNNRVLRGRIAGTPSCRALQADGGWYAVVQVPSFTSEEDLVLSLLADEHVLVHPGYFFDFATESFLVVSLLTPEPVFSDGISRMLRYFDRHASES